MGYSARYHVASLAAVFLALAIGILIGVGFGGNVVSSTKKNLEESLTGDLEAARNRVNDLNGQLGNANEFGQRVYPVLVRNRLAHRRIGVIALGGLPNGLSTDIEDALGPTGGRLVAVAVVREPPDISSLSSELAHTRLSDLATNPDTVEALGTGAGRQIVVGGSLLNRVRSRLLSRASGRFGRIDALIIARQQPTDLTPQERTVTDRLESGLVQGAAATGIPAVGVERSDTNPSSISFFSSQGVATVDNLDMTSGKVAMVFALLGAEGNFGVKSSADRLLPDLLAPSNAVQSR